MRPLGIVAEMFLVVQYQVAEGEADLLVDLDDRKRLRMDEIRQRHQGRTTENCSSNGSIGRHPDPIFRKRLSSARHHRQANQLRHYKTDTTCASVASRSFQGSATILSSFDDDGYSVVTRPSQKNCL